MKTGYEIREGSRMIAERIERARVEACRRRLALLRHNMYVAIKSIEDEMKRAA